MLIRNKKQTLELLRESNLYFLGSVKMNPNKMFKEALSNLDSIKSSNDIRLYRKLYDENTNFLFFKDKNKRSTCIDKKYLKESMQSKNILILVYSDGINVMYQLR